jgi:ATP-dependent RNA helicase RhlE
MRSRSRPIARQGAHPKKNPLFAHLTGRHPPDRARQPRRIARRIHSMNFDDLNLAPPLLKAVLEQGYTQPTPSRPRPSPSCCKATTCWPARRPAPARPPALPAHAAAAATRPPRPGAIRALVLTPTRELAAQVEESVRQYGKYLDLSSTVIFGGVGMNPQIDRIQAAGRAGGHAGRLLDLEQQGHLDLSHVEILVLDEADRMLDMGFIHDVKKVLALLPAPSRACCSRPPSATRSAPWRPTC